MTIMLFNLNSPCLTTINTDVKYKSTFGRGNLVEAFEKCRLF